MISIKKDTKNIPPAIFYKPRQVAFNKNKAAQKYVSADNLYKPKKIKTALDKIYHKKCAYCEKSLKDANRHVEHYRPKVLYFWLAFSWDNLLISCEKCNIAKSNHFEKHLEGTPIQYNNETLETAQRQIEAYNLIERPLIINPEQETTDSLKLHFTFDLRTGKIVPISPQMSATIEVCQLNRSELVEKRMAGLNRLKSDLTEDLFRLKNKKIQLPATLFSTFEKFKNHITPDTSFVAWKLFVFEHKQTILATLQKP